MGAGVSVGPSGTQILLLVVCYPPERDFIYMQVNHSPCPSENCRYQKDIEPSNGELLAHLSVESHKMTKMFEEKQCEGPQTSFPIEISPTGSRTVFICSW